MRGEMLEAGKYKKSSYSGTSCVQVALLAEGKVAVANSKDEHKPPHIYTPDEWKAFICGVKDGEFDYPA